MQKRSDCCLATVVTGLYEFERGYYKAPACGKCGKELDGDPLDACDLCGEVADTFTRIDGDDWCEYCVKGVET